MSWREAQNLQRALGDDGQRFMLDRDGFIISASARGLRNSRDQQSFTPTAMASGSSTQSPCDQSPTTSSIPSSPLSDIPTDLSDTEPPVFELRDEDGRSPKRQKLGTSDYDTAALPFPRRSFRIKFKPSTVRASLENERPKKAPSAPCSLIVILKIDRSKLRSLDQRRSFTDVASALPGRTDNAEQGRAPRDTQLHGITSQPRRSSRRKTRLSFAASESSSDIGDSSEHFEPHNRTDESSCVQAEHLVSQNEMSTSALPLPVQGAGQSELRISRNSPDVDADQSGSYQGAVPKKRGRPRISNLPALSDQSVAQKSSKEPRKSLRTVDPVKEPSYENIPADSQELVEITKTLMSQLLSEEKQEPIGQPEVWADSRQALCETLPYYRSYQSGGHCSDGAAYGFLVDGSSTPGDYMDSNVVVIRAGGGHVKDKSSGALTQQADQSDNPQTKSVRSNIAQQNPIAIICGDQNPRGPSKMPHVYSVLDWFKPTLVWPEKGEDGKIMYRYRLEKLKSDVQSWWAPRGLKTVELGSMPSPYVQSCPVCSTEFPQVYLQGWMCLKLDCPQFWRFQDGREAARGPLAYDPRFLKQYTPWSHSSAPMKLKPDIMTLSAEPAPGDDLTWEAWRGFACPQCGCCNSRETWIGWNCGNPGCGFSHRLPKTIIQARALHDFLHPLGNSYAFSPGTFHTADVRMITEFACNYRIRRFEIPEVGAIIHMVANKAINEEQGGPDDMFEELQAHDIGLARRPLPNGQIKGGSLTRHFCVNYGMPYKFIAKTASHSLDTATSAIRNTRSRLNWASRLAIRGDHRDFNEVLALGYLEKMAISYHDDGEEGLGPTIATLSLGYPATMSLRLKAKHHHGISKSGNLVLEPPVAGCENFKDRCAALDELAELKRTGDENAFKKRRDEIPLELGLSFKGNARPCVEMTIRHGDVVIMHGAKLQQYFEHAVTPMGKLRFALTCRQIELESLKGEDRPEYDILPDDIGYDGAKLPAAE